MPLLLYIIISSVLCPFLLISSIIKDIKFHTGIFLTILIFYPLDQFDFYIKDIWQDIIDVRRLTETFSADQNRSSNLTHFKYILTYYVPPKSLFSQSSSRSN